MKAAGTMPDVVSFDYQHQRASALFEQGWFVDLTDLMARDGILQDDFFPGAWYHQVLDGRVFPMPFAGSSVGEMIIVYNRDHFNQAGLAYPDSAWTWDEYDRIIRALTRDTSGDGEPDRYGVLYPHMQRYYMWVWSNGGEIVSQDLTRSRLHEPEAVGGLEWIVNQRVQFGAAHPQLSGAPFRAGQVASMGLFSLEFALRNQLDFDWSFTGLPHGPAGAINRTGSHLLAISADSTKRDAAWTFVKWLVSDEAQRLLSIELRYAVPSLKSVALADDFRYIDRAPYDFSPAFFHDARPVPPIPGTFHATVDRTLRKAWTGEISVQNAMEEIRGSLDQMLLEAQ